ncbi:acyl-CoA carboxylase subunit epsilon [Streptomyces salinarius]|uniref:acyl-CoA carboxylase subunit epsilon n=1 Tax=Streptomyces salinarius TaxID=2762598 RepID=UPI00164731C0|nr:acyl-CoA carboxylase subunit epsilon [Streptomyces salinarius]
MSGTSLSPDASALRVTRGNPTATDLAAVTAVLLAVRRAADAAEPPEPAAGRAGWERAPLPGGPLAAHRPAGSWQASRTR